MPLKIESFKYNSQSINGILHVPEKKYLLQKKIFVVLLHGLTDYRIGPNGILVEIANNLSNQGFYCLRFDFRGRGFSEGDFLETDYKTMITDVETVIVGLIENYKPYKIVLGGICYGAKLAIYYALKGSQKVDNVIELSSVPISSAKVKGNPLFFRNTIYHVQRFTAKENLNNIKSRFKSSKINRRLMNELIFKPWFLIIVIFLTDIPQLFFFKRIFRQLNQKSNFNGNILSIRGSNDFDIDASSKQIKSLCSKHKILLIEKVIKDSDKYFSSLKWKAELMQVLIGWMKEQYS